VHLFLFLLLQFFLEFLALYSYLKTSCLCPFGRSPEGAEPEVFILIKIIILSFFVRILSFFVIILTFVLRILTFVVRTKAKAQAQAQANSKNSPFSLAQMLITQI
jgi:uncharacterized membrane protein YjgN (DUF898 family)